MEETSAKKEWRREVDMTSRESDDWAHTILHLLNSPATTFSASITIRPAITALVVAMAGMMFPAMAEGRGTQEMREGERESNLATLGTDYRSGLTFGSGSIVTFHQRGSPLRKRSILALLHLTSNLLFVGMR